MAQATHKVHLASKAYLEQWAPQGLLRPVDVRYGRQKPKSPAGVAWRHQWWSSEHPELNRICEEACGRLETVSAPLLRGLEGQWPPPLEVRAALAQFISLHTVRTDGFSEWFAEVREASLEGYRDRFSPPQYETFTNVMRNDYQRAQKVLRMINKIASLIGSMHWTLLVFDEPLLITGDQPVCPVPLLDAGETRPVQAIPAAGWSETLEIRFPLSPRLALLASWHWEASGDVQHGSWHHAVNINGALRAQAQRQWFYSPERMPALPPAVHIEPVTRFEPISPAVMPGYGFKSASDSELRRRTVAEVEKLVAQQDDETLTLIGSAAA